MVSTPQKHGDLQHGCRSKQAYWRKIKQATGNLSPKKNRETSKMQNGHKEGEISSAFHKSSLWAKHKFILSSYVKRFAECTFENEEEFFKKREFVVPFSRTWMRSIFAAFSPWPREDFGLSGLGAFFSPRPRKRHTLGFKTPGGTNLIVQRNFSYKYLWVYRKK